MMLFHCPQAPGDVSVVVNKMELLAAEGGSGRIGPALCQYLYDWVFARNKLENGIERVNGIVVVNDTIFYRPNVRAQRDEVTDGFRVTLHYSMMPETEVAALVVELWEHMPPSVRADAPPFDMDSSLRISIGDWGRQMHDPLEIVDAIRCNDGNLVDTAHSLGMTVRELSGQMGSMDLGKAAEDGGTCYRSACNLVLSGFIEGAILVHGEPVLQCHPWTRYGHAWVEYKDMVFDLSLMRVFSMETYFRDGKIEESSCKRYSRKSTMAHLAAFAHWGPWQLSVSPRPT